MGFKIVFTNPAFADLEALVSFIARDNPQAAEQFGFAIGEKAEKLDQFPLLGRAVPEFKNAVIHTPTVSDCVSCA
jgi:plasmid stabilization system protein ParE